MTVPRISERPSKKTMKRASYSACPVLSLGDICGIKCGGTIIPAKWRGNGKADFSLRGRMGYRVQKSFFGGRETGSGGFGVFLGEPRGGEQGLEHAAPRCKDRHT